MNLTKYILLFLSVSCSVLLAHGRERTSHVNYRRGGHSARRPTPYAPKTTSSPYPPKTTLSPYPPKTNPPPYPPKTTPSEEYPPTPPPPTSKNPPPSYSPTTVFFHSTSKQTTPKQSYHSSTTAKPKRYSLTEKPSTKYGKQTHPPPTQHDLPYPPPKCSQNTTEAYCLQDNDYPIHELVRAVKKHQEKLLKLYVASVDDDSSNNYYYKPICSAEVKDIKPLRAVNVEDKWRIIVNDVKINYEEIIQTARIEECLSEHEPCQVVPSCYESKCLQKYSYQKFLVYDPYDVYFPFAIENFKLPSSCSCLLDASELY